MVLSRPAAPGVARRATVTVIHSLRSALLTTAALSMLGILTEHPAAAQNLVLNPSFEAVHINSPFLSSNAADIPNWTHGGAAGDALLWGVGYVDGGGSITVAGDASQFVTSGGGFGSTGTGTWTQIVAGLTGSTTYSLAFQMAAESNFNQSYTVSLTGTTLSGGQTFTTISPSPANYWRNWETKSTTFTTNAGVTSATLVFSATTNQDVGLDNVRITLASSAAPEPASLALLALSGLPVVGMVMRRRAA